MFGPWETFYLLVGTSAAALVGVMFIVTTLTSEIATEKIDRGITVYQNPIVFHLGAVFVISALVLVPDHLLPVIAALVVVIAVAGMAYSALTLWRTLERYEFYQATIADRIFYGALPVVLYVLVTGGGVAIFLGSELAAESIGAGVLLLLLVSIRNAWDVATFAVRIARGRRTEKEHGTKAAP